MDRALDDPGIGSSGLSVREIMTVSSLWCILCGKGSPHPKAHSIDFSAFSMQYLSPYLDHSNGEVRDVAIKVTLRLYQMV